MSYAASYSRNPDLSAALHTVCEEIATSWTRTKNLLIKRQLLRVRQNAVLAVSPKLQEAVRKEDPRIFRFQHGSQLLLGNVPQPLIAEGRDLALEMLVEMDRVVLKPHRHLVNHTALLECQGMNLLGCQEGHVWIADQVAVLLVVVSQTEDRVR